MGLLEEESLAVAAATDQAWSLNSTCQENDMAFRFFKPKGVRIEDSLYKQLNRAQKLRTHGELRTIEFVRAEADADGDSEETRKAKAEAREKVERTPVAHVTMNGVTIVTRAESAETERFPLGDFFIIETTSGTKARVKAYGDEPSHTGLTNLVTHDINGETERREAWKASHPEADKPKDEVKPQPQPKVKPVTPRGERFAREDAKFRGARI